MNTLYAAVWHIISKKTHCTIYLELLAEHIQYEHDDLKSGIWGLNYLYKTAFKTKKVL